jgi:hypothetical protein
MSKLIFLLAISASLYLASSQIVSGTKDVWGNGNYIFGWNIDTASQTILITLDANTTGWVGIGFGSAARGMTGFDIAVGYINTNGQAVLNDRYATMNGEPSLDSSIGGKDDFTNVSGTLLGGRTRIMFTRKLNTGDQWDFEIKKGATVTVLFAMRAAGNPSTENGLLNYHSQTQTASMILYSDAVTPTPSKNGSEMLNSTLYLCLAYLFLIFLI